MAGLFFSRKSKNGVSTPADAAAVTPDGPPVYEPMPAPPSLLDDPPDSIAGIPDLYGVLGVDPRSSDDIIRYAYRKKAAKLHDARWRPGRAARQLAELNAAYEILGKPDRRADYDRQRARLYYYQEAARHEIVAELPPPATGGGGAMHTRAPRAAAPWRAPRAPRGLLEVIAIIGVVAVAIYAGYTVLGNGAWVNLGGLQDAGAALGLPVRPRTAPEPTAVPVLAAPTPTPRQVIVPQVAVASPTPAAAPVAPAPPPASGPVRTTVRVSNPAPPRRSDIGITVRLTRDNRAVVGVPVYVVARYRTVDERFPAGDGTVLTNDIGEATITFNVGDATAGHAVNVDVIAQVEGETIQTQTSFLPR